MKTLHPPLRFVSLRNFKTTNYAEILELQLNLDGNLVGISYAIKKKDELERVAKANR